MSHNVRLNKDGFYANAVPLPASFYQGIDTSGSKAINADAGGTWSPTTPIQIGGAGVWLCGQTQMSGGATIATNPGSGKRIVCAANDTIMMTAGHDLSTHVMVTGIAANNALMSPWGPILGGQSAVGGDTSSNHATGAAGVIGNGSGMRILVPLSVHDGAVFSEVLLTFEAPGVAIGSVAHSAVPASLPQMRVYATDVFGNIIPLGGLAGTPGWQMLPAPATPAAYKGPIGMTYNIFPGVVVNRSVANYFCEIVDEAGPGAIAGNLYTLVSCLFQGITNHGYQ